MKKVISIAAAVFMMCLIICPSDSYAESERTFTLDNNTIVTNDAGATYIEGSVKKACGQEIIVKKGLNVVAEKTMPDTGSEETFRIRIPAKSIRSTGLNVFSVKEKDPKGEYAGSRERVEIRCAKREPQEIKLARKNYKLTFPGESTKIEASATSGDKLIYESSDPKVAKVDSNGNIITTGAGKAVITAKQIGNGRYKEAEKDIKVSVKSVDAYTITFHSSDDENAVEKQIIKTGSTENLRDNSFKNGEHEFLGWAKSDDGLVEYWDGDEVSELGKTGDNIDLYAVWTGDGARAAVAWAEKIANDDSFAYGHIPETSGPGCYFCGTNQYLKPAGYEKTYVCLTFIEAAYAHGAEDPEMLAACRAGKVSVALDDSNLTKYSCWERVGSASSLTADDLKPGDVIVYYSSDAYDNGHVGMYVGNNSTCDAASWDGYWGPETIAVREGDGNDMLGRAASHSSNSYVMRYVGPNA